MTYSTPGPWHWTDNSPGYGGDAVLFFGPDERDETRHLFLFVKEREDLNAEDMANLVLITAAPDMHAALLAFLEPAGDTDADIRQQARAALAKANGGTA